MANQNAMLEMSELDNADFFDFDELETKLQSDLDSQLSELEFLKEDREKIGNPDNLGKVVMNVVWEQFLNQMAATAGEDFIMENRGLTLDLRDEAHIQTTENFANGKIATHNDKIDYQQRHDDWLDNFRRNEDGTVKTNADNPNYKGDKPDQKILKTKKVDGVDARAPFDNGRDKGSVAVNNDHVVSVAEQVRDPKLNAHVEKQEQINFANSEANIQELDGRANSSKRDKSTSEWLDSENKEGKKPAERFPIDEEKLRENDRIAREEYEKLKDEGERKSIETGKQSQKEEAFRIGGKALRSVVMLLLAELIKAIIGKLISWLKSANKNLESLLDNIKSAISTFIGNLKTHLINAGSTIITTIATAILGPIVRTLKKVWIMLKQGWKSLKEAIAYLKSPDNKNKPFGMLLLEVGKIVVAGLSAVGAIALGEVIEKGLMTIPVLAFEIPILGSLASLLGLFLGGLVAGIVGAIAISLIDKAVAKQVMGNAIKTEIIKGNEVLNTQNTLINLSEKKLEQTKYSVASTISERHKSLAKTTKEALDNIFNGNTNNEIVISENEKALTEINKAIEALQS